MTQECTLKELFIAKKLDEFQPTWRKGDDVVFDTKKKVQNYILTHYDEMFDITGSACITFLSIERTIKRLRKKLDIQSKRAQKSCVTWLQNEPVIHAKDNNLNVFQSTVRSGEVEPKVEFIDDIAYANHVPPVPVSIHNPSRPESMNVPEMLQEPKQKVRTIELVQMSCNNPLCDQFAFVTQEDKWYFLVTSPMRYGKFIRPYCSTKCKEEHIVFLKSERIKSIPV